MICPKQASPSGRGAGPLLLFACVFSVKKTTTTTKTAVQLLNSTNTFAAFISIRILPVRITHAVVPPHTNEYFRRLDCLSQLHFLNTVAITD